MHWYIDVIKKYAVFSGRARRKEYWMFFLFNVIISFVLTLIETLAGGPGVVVNIYSLIILLPSIGVAIRRMHDTNRRGWWILLPIVNLVFLAWEGDKGENRFGPNPKANTI